MASLDQRVSGNLKPVARRDGLELAIAVGGRFGIGDVIVTERAERLIQGVTIVPLQFWPDDRGYFAELLRAGQGLAAGVSTATLEVSGALSYPGTIKAFHYHSRQTDIWTPVVGMLQVALYDLRVGSPSFGAKNTLYIGELRPWSLRIPPGVGHGYKVLGTRPALLVYATDRFYDPQDEGRIPYSDPDIHYDWEIQHK
jgi:dTDP-4-dehydrorhamnose 3,5-epimerase